MKRLGIKNPIVYIWDNLQKFIGSILALFSFYVSVSSFFYSDFSLLDSLIYILFTSAFILSILIEGKAFKVIQEVTCLAGGCQTLASGEYGIGILIIIFSILLGYAYRLYEKNIPFKIISVFLAIGATLIFSPKGIYEQSLLKQTSWVIISLVAILVICRVVIEIVEHFKKDLEKQRDEALAKAEMEHARAEQYKEDALTMYHKAQRLEKR